MIWNTWSVPNYFKDSNYHKRQRLMWLQQFKKTYISLICDRSVTTQNLVFLNYWYIKKRLQMHF